MPEFSVRISGDEFSFSAAHFITYGAGQCESLHGHNYRATAEVFGPVDENRYVIDFVVFGEMLKNILRELDHGVLLPADHPTVAISTSGEEIEVRHGVRRWVFPRGDCRLLPIGNVTVEMLAQYIGQRLIDALEVRMGRRPGWVRIELEEYPGRTAICEV